jgi:hypothetical protein
LPVQEVTHLPSIQGEQFKQPAYTPLTNQEADEYVDRHSEELVDCRVGNHAFPIRRRKGQVQFNGIDRLGRFTIDETCTCCGCATRHETWDAFEVGRGRNKEWRWERVSKTIYYHPNENGETYLLPKGSGRGKPTQFLESRMTAAMAGQSPAAMRKALERAQAS